MSNLKINKSEFGTLYDGTKIQLYTVSNAKMSFSTINYGCTITSILLPCAERKVDILLGCSTLEGYAASDYCFGTLVGRFANRIGNAKFSLGGKTYTLDKNDGENCLHGGFDRYEKKVWEAKEFHNGEKIGIEFSRVSYAGEQGMPGRAEIEAIYSLDEENNLTLEYSARVSEPTPVNLTNHAYFNLKGYDGGSVEDLELKLNSSKYLEVDSALIPTGRLIDVNSSKVFDFRTPKLIGKDIKSTGIGYDHAFCVDGYDGNGSLAKVALLRDPESGRSMEVSTTLPACQIYTANFIEGVVGKNGHVQHAHDAICMETEAYPDAVNQSSFPSCIASPEKPYHEVTVYKFEF